jgi:hypothetical protein
MEDLLLDLNVSTVSLSGLYHRSALIARARSRLNAALGRPGFELSEELLTEEESIGRLVAE